MYATSTSFYKYIYGVFFFLKCIIGRIIDLCVFYCQALLVVKGISVLGKILHALAMMVSIVMT